MRHLRSTWWKRGVVGILFLSLLPLLAARPGGTGAEAASTHRAWLQAQMVASPTADVEAAIDAALEAATNEAAPTRRAFTAAFAEAYVQHDASVPLATLFAAPDVDRERLYDILSRRSTELSRTAVLPRHAIGAAPGGLLVSRTAGIAPPSLPLPPPARLVAVQMLDPVERAVPCLIRILSSARPMAP